MVERLALGDDGVSERGGDIAAVAVVFLHLAEYFAHEGD